MLAAIVVVSAILSFTAGQAFEVLAEQQRLKDDVTNFGHVYLYDEVYSCRVGP